MWDISHSSRSTIGVDLGTDPRGRGEDIASEIPFEDAASTSSDDSMVAINSVTYHPRGFWLLLFSSCSNIVQHLKQQKGDKFISVAAAVNWLPPQYLMYKVPFTKKRNENKVVRLSRRGVGF